MKGDWGDVCATRDCRGLAEYVSDDEQRVRGDDTPYRCRECCRDIAARYHATGQLDATPPDGEGMAVAIVAVGLFIAVLIGLALLAALL